MKKLVLIPALIFASMFPAISESGINFSADIQTKWGVAAPWTDSENAGRFTLGKTSFLAKLDAYYENCSAYAEADFSFDAANMSGGNLTNGFNLSLGELWLDYTDSFWGVRVGRQKAAWGKADGINVTNVLCPSDMSSFSAMTGDNGNLSVDALRFSFNGNSFTADAYWIPFFTPSSLPLNEGNPLRRFVVPSSVEFPIPGVGKTSLPVSIGEIKKPELAIWNGEWGVKLSGYFSALDVSLYGFYGWDDTPFLDYSILYGEPNPPYPAMPNGIKVGGEYKHMGMVGADAAFPIGETVLRLETAFFPQRHFQKSAAKIIEEKNTSTSVETSERHNELSALAGLDWMPSGWTLTAQYYCDVVFGNLDNLERANAYEHGMTLSVSKSLVNETLELGVSGILGLNDFDSMISPTVKYSLSDYINLGLGAYVFIPGPSRTGKYGAYKNLSSIYISAKISF